MLSFDGAVLVDLGIAASAEATSFTAHGTVVATPAWIRIRRNLRRPKRYHRRVRHVFHMPRSSRSISRAPSRDFYRRKRAEGKRHTQAVIALARRLVDVI
jgi:hypothetical protein